VDAVPSESLLEKIAGLKKRQPNIPIISLYVYSERAKELEERLRSHVDALYYKPIDVNDLSSRIAELLPA
jgi:response regulator RpfG family c-di-GMP phosphodiesterase